MCSRPSDEPSNTSFTMPLPRNSSNHLLSGDPIIHLSLRSAPSPLEGAPSKVKDPGSPFTLTPKASHVTEERESGFEDMEDVDANMILEIQRKKYMNGEQETPVHSPQNLSQNASVSPLTSESNAIVKSETPVTTPRTVTGIAPEANAPSTSSPADQHLGETNPSNIPFTAMNSDNTQPSNPCPFNINLVDASPPDIHLSDSRQTDFHLPVSSHSNSSTESLPPESPRQEVQQAPIKGVITRRKRKVHAPAIARGENSIFMSSSSSTSLSYTGTKSGLSESVELQSKQFPLDSQIDKPVQLSRYSIGRINSLFP